MRPTTMARGTSLRRCSWARRKSRISRRTICGTAARSSSMRADELAKLAPCDDADDVLIAIDDRIEPLRARPRLVAERIGKRADFYVRGQDRDVRAHHLADEENLERIDRVFARQVVAAPAH